MDAKLFNYITNHQSVWCKIREKQKQNASIMKSRIYNKIRKDRQQLLLLQTASEKS